ncbi:SxtJ family membrane protein [Spirosoma radiotolerans]|uniref:Membrane protein n=1 Tax=Spirosoma radiotolerans TaxID=1379870 RepID=A0A0E3V583_9BACT|nr:SxtJ family membrane protein [Spirosoma radiotolerans]AKD53952.1 membrane protein [Spirosoma radiotolerans]
MDITEKVKAQLVIVTGLVVLYFITKSPWFLYGAAAVGVLSLAVPAVGDLIVKAWFKLAEVLGNINGKIILSVLFFVFLFPIALLYRMTAKNPLAIKRTGNTSFYTERNHLYTKEDMEDAW